MSRYSAVSTAVVLWILMMAQDALAAEGTIFTPGQIVVNYGNTAIVKVSNRTSSPLVNVVVLAVGGKDVIEFQQTLRAIRPRQTVDILFPPPRDPLNWQPIAFVPAPASQKSVYFDLFIHPPTSQYPNKLWRAIPDSEFTAPDVVSRFSEDLDPWAGNEAYGPVATALETAKKGKEG